MSFYNLYMFWAGLIFAWFASVSAEEVNLTIPDTQANGELKRLPLGTVVLPESPIFKPAANPFFSLSLFSDFPEDLEVSDYCVQMLGIFGQRYTNYVNCLVPSARPVKVCQNCFARYGDLLDIYTNISSDKVGPGNVSCRDSLLRSDRLMVIFLLYDNLKDIWDESLCTNCVNAGFTGLTDHTLKFMTALNESLTCFEKYQQQGNQSELCLNCKSSYRSLNEIYSLQEKNHSLCIDVEDSMNMTRRLWSITFNCTFPREETVPVIAVSSFMLFLPIIFYLSSFLHSEQKKRKLIHPKRAKSTTLMNIQDRVS